MRPGLFMLSLRLLTSGDKLWLCCCAVTNIYNSLKVGDFLMFVEMRCLLTLCMRLLTSEMLTVQRC